MRDVGFDAEKTSDVWILSAMRNDSSGGGMEGAKEWWGGGRGVEGRWGQRENLRGGKKGSAVGVIPSRSFFETRKLRWPLRIHKVYLELKNLQCVSP